MQPNACHPIQGRAVAAIRRRSSTPLRNDITGAIASAALGAVRLNTDVQAQARIKVPGALSAVDF